MKTRPIALTAAALVAGIVLTPAKDAADAPVALFDGKTLEGWTNAKGDAPGAGWVVEEGTLCRKGKSGDLFSAKNYADFELSFEWKVSEGANSGVKYRMTRYGGRLLGPEYQVLDDDKHPDGKNGADRQAAALYDLLPANDKKELKAVGEWNSAKIVANGSKLEHWLNGEKVVDVDTTSEDFAKMRADSKFKGVEGFGSAPEGRIMLQDHGDEVWYRNISIKEINKSNVGIPGPDGWASMFDGKTLTGWKVNSENPGSFQVMDGAIKVFGPRTHLFFGEDGNAKYKDFEFEAEVKTTEGSNAGIFFHTAFQDNGWPHVGYEAQVNASHKDWRKTGSVYSFQDVKGQTHRDDEWFTYNIKVQGKRVVITIDGKVVNDYTEPADHKEATKRLGEGTIGLQAHDPKSLVWFRKMRIKRL